MKNSDSSNFEEMNHCVPVFEMDEDCAIPSSSGLPRQKNMQEDEIMELLWQNGQVVVQSQTQRLHRKSSPPPAKILHHHQQQQKPQKHRHPTNPAAPPPDGDSTSHYLMQEDEMISWLQCPLDDPSFDRDLVDLFYHPPGTPPSSSTATAALRLRPPPPPPPVQTVHHDHQHLHVGAPWSEGSAMDVNVPDFSKVTARFPDSVLSTSSTVVDSSETPAVRQKSRISPVTRSAFEVSGRGKQGCDSLSGGGGAIGVTSAAVHGGGCLSMNKSRESENYELTLTSSPSGSGASASATATANLTTPPPADDRKRKGREPNHDTTTECQSEDVEIESFEAMKQSCGAVTKRSRAAEVHNLSERRRRDRINDRMRALQELIPRCSKTDKASMLDEAIEYLKSLQLQVQMMSMGCGMVPVMFPGVQQYVPSMGMGMGIGMGITRQMMPFPTVFSGSSLPTSGAPSHLNLRFPLQPFQMPSVPGHDPSRTQQAGNQADPSVSPLGVSGHNMARIPNMADYQQCIGTQHIPMQIPLNQPTSQPSTGKPSASGGGKDNEGHQSDR